MATPSPIIGITTMKVGSVSTFTDATPGGVWSSSNTLVATVDVNGVVTAVAQGSAQIIYTVGSDAIALQITIQAVSSLTNGYDFNTVYAALQNRVLWQSQGLISDSQRYFEDFHVLNDTVIIDQLRPKTLTLSAYLANMQRSVCMEMLNSIYNAPQIIDHAKLVFYRDDDPLPLQFVQGVGQFVGLKIFVAKGDHAVKFNSLQLFFTKDVSFNLYLYNDFFLAPVMTIPVTARAYEETIIDLGETIILNNLVPTAYKGGRWYLGYWQDDLTDSGAVAIYYPVNYSKFHPVNVMAFSAPVWTDPKGNKNFQRNNIGANNLMYGMNLEISTFVDGTNNIVQNKHLFDELFGLMMAAKTLENIVFSYRVNDIQNILNSNVTLEKIYIELNQAHPGETIPFSVGLRKQIERETWRVKQAFQKQTVISIGK